MMTESQALETLTREDPEAGGDAKAAVAWLTGDEGLETISLLRLQEFLWYALPVKWPMSTPGRVGVAKALGRLFLLAGLDRYAGVCSSAGTEKIITAYADGHEEGIAAYTEAIEESHAAPPDTALLAWGSVMGSPDRAASDACPRSPTTRCPRCAGCSVTRARACGSPRGTTSRRLSSPRRSTSSAGATSSSVRSARNSTCSRCTRCAAWRRARWGPSAAAGPAWCSPRPAGS